MSASPEIRRNVTTTRLLAVNASLSQARSDRLVGEEPMEIRAAGPSQDPVSVAVTMRTPGNDFELAAGFLFTEGLIDREDVARISYCDELEGDQAYNVVTVRLKEPFNADLGERRFHMTSSCGICGKTSIDQVEVHCSPVGDETAVAPEVLAGLPDALRSSQRLFEQTGGIHAAGLFDADGSILSVSEDVGRHNAVDKLIGRALLRDGLPLSDKVVIVSGRIGFEIVQKVAVAGAPILGGIGAPTDLAVDAAERLGVTVLGFMRAEGFNCYSHPQRAVAAERDSSTPSI